MVCEKEEANNAEHKNQKSGAQNSFKIAFLGRPGSGKKSAVSSIGKGLIFSSDEDSKLKLFKYLRTKIGIDYNQYKLKDGSKMELYVMPNRKHFNDMHQKVMLNADVYLILIDLSSVVPLQEFEYYNKLINEQANHQALKVVVFTHYDQRLHPLQQLSQEIRHKCFGEILTVKIDARNEAELRFMLQNAISLKLGNIPSKQYYAENNLFLKNMNH